MNECKSKPAKKLFLQPPILVKKFHIKNRISCRTKYVVYLLKCPRRSIWTYVFSLLTGLWTISIVLNDYFCCFGTCWRMLPAETCLFFLPTTLNTTLKSDFPQQSLIFKCLLNWVIQQNEILLFLGWKGNWISHNALPGRQYEEKNWLSPCRVW